MDLSICSYSGLVPKTVSGSESYITDAVVSLFGSEDCVPVKMLPDTGITQSFIVESVLLISPETERGDFFTDEGYEAGFNSCAAPQYCAGL